MAEQAEHRACVTISCCCCEGDTLRKRKLSPAHQELQQGSFLCVSSNMPIKPFSFPVPETRFLHSKEYVYKFKIRYGVSFSSQHIENKGQALQELVESIRAIIANHDNLYPFFTRHFIIFPYKSKWESASCLQFKYGHRSLLPFPYVFTLYIEPYSIIQENCAGRTKEQNCEESSQHEDEDGESNENCVNVDNGASQETSCLNQPARIPCSHAENRGRGFLQYLISFTPLRFLFGRSSSL